MDIPVIIDKDGKKVFIGKQDPTTPPVQQRHPNMRYCNKCGKESENDKERCDFCGRAFSDGKMQCQVCHRYFDYLLGENANGGVQGCELDWKPATNPGKAVHDPISTEPTFD